ALNPARGRSPSARSSQSMRVYSGTGRLHSRSQRLKRPQLQLLDGPLGLLQLRRHFADAALLDVALDDHGALIGRQLVDEAEHSGQPLDLVEVVVYRRFRPADIADERLVARSPGAVVERVGGDPDQPRAERDPAHLVL